MLQTRFAFCTDASHKLTGGGQPPKQVSVPDRSSKPRDFLIQCCAEIIFPSLPAFHKPITYGASGVRPRPRMLAHDVEYPRSLCVTTLGSHDVFLGAFVT